MRLGAAAGSLMVAATLVRSAPHASTSRRYWDDSFDMPRQARVMKIHGDQGFNGLKFSPRKLSGNTLLDLRDAHFHVANSRNGQPTAAFNCDHGTLPVNRYPLVIEHMEGVAVIGGLFLGQVPQTAEWQATYCNSAAITFNNAAHGRIDGVRITGAWDGVRLSEGAKGLIVTNSWISSARDDAFENDFLHSASISDTLIDGAFQGISVKPRRGSLLGDASNELVTLSGVLLRLSQYDYKDQPRFGALLKSDGRAPKLRVLRSVVAIEHRDAGSYPQFWRTTWSKLHESSNNLFLWLSDVPVPAFVAPPPGSFKVLTGNAARQAWKSAKTNWINCHPKLAHLPTDPPSNPRACVANTWGGFSN